MSGFELLKSDMDNLTGIGVLTDEEVEVIQKHCSTLINFQNHHELIEYVIINYNNLFDALFAKAREASDVNGSVFHYPFANMSLQLNILILNFLSSARILLEHFDTQIVREYSTQSVQYKDFKKTTAFEFDSKFSYGFLYKLRNYVSHCGMPPLSYNISKLFDDENHSQNVSLIINFNRDALLQRYDSWGAPVKLGLTSQEKEFAAIPLFNENMYSLLKIYTEHTNQFVFPEVVIAKKFLLQTIGESDDYADNNYHIGKITPKDETNVNIKLNTLPLSILSKVTHYEKLVKIMGKHLTTPYFYTDELRY
ncbi:hypothetical protein [Pantoea sp. SORGH_AS_0659]|uniref:hypothetical protein n=1 Tax=Pantoea sp. SORGH_AS_0659 TaxID=3062597 RepID=UPI0028591488|nr:hypothetical protein [Pantoea sp. SORGH_AS_0659]MDR6350687.1 hypothetical protein [Pantoea sp. SORGH_AS_0659]